MRRRRLPAGPGARPRITMLLENDLYPQDVRVRDEALSLTEAGYHVHVIAPRGEGQNRRETVNRVEVERFWTPRELGDGIAALLIEYLVAHVQLYVRACRALWRGADAIHLHNPPDTLFVAAMLGRALGRRAVFDMHDLFPELLVAKLGHSPLFRLAVALQSASVRTAHLVLATNESQREVVLGRTRVSPERVVVVRNAPPASALERPVITREGPLDDPRLIYVGALEAQDGVDRLADVLERLLSNPALPGTSLTVVGWGTRRRHIEERLRERRLSRHVTFTGRVSQTQALGLVAEADICLDVAECGDLNHRTTMVKIAEYLALGKPTVSFALRETMTTAADSMLYAPCGDWDRYIELIRTLSLDGELRSRLGRRARERGAELTWDVSATQLVTAYQRLLPSSSRGKAFSL